MMSSEAVQFIPFDVQVEILNRMNDVKSLMRFRAISKAWKSHIESPKFMTDHHQRQRRHLIIVHDKHFAKKIKPVSVIVDNDDSFPRDQYSFTLPSTLSQRNSSIESIGSSYDGLLGYYRWCAGNLSIVLWNPTIRKSVAIGVHTVIDPKRETNVGFGVYPGSSDPKLVKINSPRPGHQHSDDALILPWEVEVCTLSSGVWRSPLGISKLPRKSISLSCWLWDRRQPVVINGIIYWLAWDSANTTDRLFSLLISFDLETEEFEEIYLPDNLVKCFIYLAKRSESIVVIEYPCNIDTETRECGVWVMNHHPKSFTKLYSVIKENVPSYSLFEIREFRKNGDPILETNYVCSATLELYEPCSEYSMNQMNYIDLGFHKEHDRGWACYTVTAYTESLLLLDHHSAKSIIDQE